MPGSLRHVVIWWLKRVYPQAFCHVNLFPPGNQPRMGRHPRFHPGDETGMKLGGMHLPVDIDMCCWVQPGMAKKIAEAPTKLNEHSRTLNYPAKYLIWPLKTTHFMDDFTIFSYKDWRLK